MLGRPNEDSIVRVPAIALLAANVIPLFGVLLLDWDVFSIMLLFWFENVIVGVFNVLRMLTCQPTDMLRWAGKLYLIPFFCLHYGMFTYVHGMFVITLFGPGGNADGSFPGPTEIIVLFASAGMWIGATGLALSHLASFVFNYLVRGEYATAALSELMARPYGRVVILHLTIIFGGMAVQALGSPVWALVLLIIIKSAIDLKAHLKKNAPRKSPALRGA